MAKRSRGQQTKHDRGVEQCAEYYTNQGYAVEADISGWDMPESINDKRPDVRARKGGSEIIVEVETKDSFEGDAKQREVFQTYADKSKYRRFRTKIV